MKYNIAFLCSMILILSQTSTASILPISNPIEYPIPVSKIYAPYGFDDNDNVQVVVEGTFPNTCHRLGGTHVQIVGKHISITQRAFVLPDITCIKKIVPFYNVIDLGKLKSGNYIVFSVLRDSNVFCTHEEMVNTRLSVEEAPTTDVDSHPYANVETVTINETNVVLEGSLYDSCVRLNRTIIDLQEDVIVILPITSRDDSNFCLGVVSPFRLNLNLSAFGIKGRYLIHIRSDEGASYNQIQDFY